MRGETLRGAAPVDLCRPEALPGTGGADRVSCVVCVVLPVQDVREEKSVREMRLRRCARVSKTDVHVWAEPALSPAPRCGPTRCAWWLRVALSRHRGGPLSLKWK